jgi:hypothetical protein
VQHKSWASHFAKSATTLTVLVMAGLVAYILSVLLGFALLILDAVWALNGHKTITEFVCESWWRIAAVLGFALLGWVGLALHFLVFKIQEMG